MGKIIRYVFFSSSGECISLGSACDAVPDCQDGSDESEAKCQVEGFSLYEDTSL